jgi:hypothetical protein
MPNSNKKMTLVTKIKKRWRISSTSKSIASAKKFCKLLANSRMIILERVRECNSNFLYAIAKCCSINIMGIEQDISKAYYTLRDAVKTIENDSAFECLRNMLSSHFTTYYKCLKCECTPSSLSNIYECICIYEPDIKHPPISAVPLASKNSLNLECSVCNEKTENVILPMHAQIHHQYPSILMYNLSRTTHQALKKLSIELNSQDIQCKYIYKPSSILLVDEYNSISVIKLQQNLVYGTSPYETSAVLSDDQINELCFTAQSVIVFLEQVKVHKFKSTDLL